MKNEITTEVRVNITADVALILAEILPEKDALRVSIGVKRGGYTATADPDKNRIEVRANCWNKLDVFGRRVLLCHEVLHLKKWEHGSSNLYGNSMPDLASLELYRAVWGDDAAKADAMAACRAQVRKTFPEHYRAEG